MKTGDLVRGIVQRVTSHAVHLTLDGGAQGALPMAEQLPGDRFAPGDTVRAVVRARAAGATRTEPVLSRTQPDFVLRLLELAVPDLAGGAITVRGIVREPGHRTKVAVHAADRELDCVGACLGADGMRLQPVVDELHGEQIDIVRWYDDPVAFLREALRPGKVGRIEIDPAGPRALVQVTEAQLTATIGFKGRNVRLASRLTGMDIDLMTPEESVDPSR